MYTHAFKGSAMKGLSRLNILFPLITAMPLLFSACDIYTNSGLVVEVYVPEKVYPGTTLLGDTHDPNNPRIIEVSMSGEIVWQLTLKGYAADLSPGFFYKAERIGAESTTD